MFIKKIFEGVFDEEVHDQFVKFSRGEFKEKYLVNAKKQSNKWVVKTGPEYANYLVRNGLENASDPLPVKGIIVSTFDLRDELDFDVEKVSNFQGIRKNVINTQVDPKKITSLMDKYPRVFFALTFYAGQVGIKVKPKAPKSGKPGKETDEVKADFCTIKTDSEDMIKDLFFDVGLDFKEIAIKHKVVVEDIVYPEDFASLKPKELREKSKRKGKLYREIKMDNQTRNEEAEFIA